VRKSSSVKAILRLYYVKALTYCWRAHKHHARARVHTHTHTHTHTQVSARFQNSSFIEAFKHFGLDKFAQDDDLPKVLIEDRSSVLAGGDPSGVCC
jgi:hypothetical protein